MPDLSKAYEPQAVEEKWYRYWLDQSCFTADPASPKPAYAIVIPPPNVTGVLHMGHVLNNTIQDILARKARMDGKEVLWLPGTDHAGIATEGMVVRQLKKEEKKSKQDLGRDEFIKRVWAWKEKHGGIIIHQLKKLGCSCDWTRERFTMEPEYVRCVQKVFVDLYKKGLIYRGKRMVNWCPATQTALSDEEVEMKPQKGFMYHFKVEVAGGSLSPTGGEDARRAGEGAAPVSGPITDTEGRTWLTIATTRPETIPGDTAVAVNPKDPRYAHLIGQHIVRPLPCELPREQKLIPIVGDDHVDFEFGTGVLKVTPAHDKADFDIGQRHSLPVVDIMHPDGRMNDLAGADLKGLDRFEARKVAVAKLRELGSLVDEKPYENNIGFSQRADVPIEPRLSEQWFLQYPSVEKSKACVVQSDDPEGRVPRVPNLNAGDQGLAELVPPSSGRMRFHPQRWAKVYDHWLENIQDWCISRQLWWGHRIPVWSRGSEWYEKQTTETRKASFEYLQHISTIDPENVILRGRVANAEMEPEDFEFLEFQNTIVCLNPGLDQIARKLEGFGFTQDADVLDTWFSSWLWPFATMGWPEQTSTLKKFYPTTDLVTAPEIIFFWVARMIMAGYEYMGEMPFRDVYFTGIVRDKQGRKMSKTLGNSPDPLDLIATYGADAVRFGTMRGAPLGQDVLFDEKDVELGRNFCNKLWNACRFRQMQGGEVQGEIDGSRLSSDDKWILLKLHQAIKEITASLASYNFSEATATLYRFFWNEYCDWYVESSKAVLARPVEPLNRLTVESETASTLQPLNPSTPPVATPPSPAEERRRQTTLAVMDFVLSHTLRLFHPFLPFITEELWHGMGYAEDMPENQGGRSIMFAPWPKPFDSDARDHYSLDDCYLEFAALKQELVTQGRNMRREANISAAKKISYVLKPSRDLPPNDIEVMRLLLNAEKLELNADYEPRKGTASVRCELGDLYLPLEGLIDVAAETARLTKELEKIQGEIDKVAQKLANPAFTQKVPPAVLQDHQKRLADWQAKHAHVKKALDGLSAA